MDRIGSDIIALSSCRLALVCDSSLEHLLTRLFISGQAAGGVQSTLQPGPVQQTWLCTGFKLACFFRCRISFLNCSPASRDLLDWLCAHSSRAKSYPTQLTVKLAWRVRIRYCEYVRFFANAPCEM